MNVGIATITTATYGHRDPFPTMPLPSRAPRIHPTAIRPLSAGPQARASTITGAHPTVHAARQRILSTRPCAAAPVTIP